MLSFGQRVVESLVGFARNPVVHVDRFGQMALSLVRQPIARRRLFILIAAILVCTYALGVVAYVSSIPDIGLRSAFTPIVTQIYPDYILAPTEELPDLRDNRILQVGDHHIGTWPDLLRALIHLRDRDVQGRFTGSFPETSYTYIEFNGEPRVKVRLGFHEGETYAERTVWCRVGSAPLESFAPSVLWFLLKAGLFAVGVLVYWKRPGDRSAAQFFLLCIVTVGAYIGGYHWSQILTQPVLALVFMVCSVLLPAVSLHFYLVFPRPKAFLERRPALALLVIYGPPVVFLAVLMFCYLLLRYLFNGGASEPVVELFLHAILSEIYVYLVVSTLWYIASVVCLVHSYQTARDGMERNQVSCLLLGALFAMVPFGYSLFLAFFDPRSFGGGAAAWPMFAASACFTVAFTVSITRYRLMQLNEIISSGMVYFLISTAAGLVYYALVFLVMLVVGSQVISGPSFTQALWVSGTTLVLLVVLDLVRSRVRAALDKHFHREKYQLDRTLERLSHAVEQLVDPEAIARRWLGVSADLLSATRGAVYLRAGEPPIYRLTDHLGDAPPLTELSSGCPLIEALRSRGTLLARGGEGASWWSGRATNGGAGNGGRVHDAPLVFRPLPPQPDPARRQLEFLGGEAAHALLHEGQLLAILVLGSKAHGSFGSDDLKLLGSFAQITALALVSAEGRRTIEVLNHDLQAKVEKIGEQQRRILALQSQLMKQGSGLRSSGSAAREHEPEKATDGPARSTSDPSAPTPASGIIGSSSQVRQLLQLVKKVSASELAVLLRGESGTGKELMARALHENSTRAGKPYVKVHCAALSPSLLESELFGHVKGAFTGAHRDKVGRFELADGGTLFLDEIGDISLEVQTKLLRVLEEKVYERVGSSEPAQADVRVIAATHQDLEGLMLAGRFREDLFYRLNRFPIVVPPLRDRREDIPELALHFLQRYCLRCGKDVTQIDDDAMMRLKAYHWPGNIRQLENVIERAVVIVDGPTITEYELPPEVIDAESPPEATGQEEKLLSVLGPGLEAERAERDRQEKERLVRALAAAGGVKAEAARALGLKRSTLVSRLKKHGLS
jgi:transcriptional regulator with GAF, ATPase, and Fis domain